jgi:hypothetical protein
MHQDTKQSWVFMDSTLVTDKRREGIGDGRKGTSTHISPGGNARKRKGSVECRSESLVMPRPPERDRSLVYVSFGIDRGHG